MRPYAEGQSLQNIIQTAVPDFVEAEYPLFMEFVQTFCRFLETQRTLEDRDVSLEYGVAANGVVQETVSYGGPIYEARKLLEYRDVESTLDEFVKYFLGMFAKNFPQYSYVPADLLVRALRQFYQGKGTSDSIKWFFRTFFNETADVYFPREDILKASDGTWVAPITIKVSQPIADPDTGVVPANSDVERFYVGQRVQTMTGSAQVERVATTIVGQGFNQHIIVNELTLKFDSILGTFAAGQTLNNIDSDTKVYTTILPVVSSVIVNTGGSNYLPGDLVNFSEGPSGGQGYGALGSVAAIASTALNGVLVIDGGSGYITGLPVTFTSSTGSGATAVVGSIVYGEVLLEAESGYLLVEDSTPATADLFQLEDVNVLFLELVIEPFVNATATVTLDSPDYGAATGVAQLDGVVLDSSIEIALEASDTKPFMHPWVFTDAEHTTAELANVATMVQLTSNTFFANGLPVFALSSITDVSTNATNASVSANVIASDIFTGGAGKDLLYLKQVANSAFIVNGLIWKQSGNGTSQAGTITAVNGSSNVVGTNTSFTTAVTANAHIRFDDGSHHVVRAVVNNTFLQTFSPVTANVAANTWSIVPTGSIVDITLQAQRYYGKIKSVTLLTNGDHYETPPVVTADSISAQAQQLFYLEPDPGGNTANNQIVASDGRITVFSPATLQALQDSGQITKVKILASGVAYTDANGIVITAIHGDGRTGSNAVFTPVIGTLTQYPGAFTTTRGFLSADKYLQDADFYNNYTYVVKVAESFDRYRAILLKLMHPAGFKAVGRFVEVLTADAPTVSAANTSMFYEDDYAYHITQDGPIAYFRMEETDQAYAEMVNACNPIGYWRMEDVSGNVVVDASGFNNNGTVNTGITMQQTGALLSDFAFSFDGTGNFDVANPSANLAGDLTIEFWMNPSTLATRQTIATKGSGNEFELTMESTAGNTTVLNCYTGNNVNKVSLSVYTANAWQHCVVVRDTAAKTWTFYRNGAVVGTPQVYGANTVPTSTRVITVGASTTYAQHYSGLLDELAIYPRALSASEIAAHYALRTSTATRQAKPTVPNLATGHSANVAYVNNIVTFAQAGALADGSLCYQFTNGSPSTCLYANSYVFNNAAALTLEAWVHHQNVAWRALNSSHEIVLSLGSAGHYLDAQSGNAHFSLFPQGGAQVSVVAPVALTANAWHHLVLTWTQGDYARLYVDGTLIVNSSAVISNVLVNATGVIVGTFPGGNSSNIFNCSGLIDEVAIYDKALTATQVLDHYNMRLRGDLSLPI